jgi:hypothetical protein
MRKILFSFLSVYKYTYVVRQCSLVYIIMYLCGCLAVSTQCCGLTSPPGPAQQVSFLSPPPPPILSSAPPPPTPTLLSRSQGHSYYPPPLTTDQDACPIKEEEKVSLANFHIGFAVLCESNLQIKSPLTFADFSHRINWILILPQAFLMK